MISRAAIGLALLSEALAAYTVAEWFAAGYDAGDRAAIPWILFAVVAFAGFLVARATTSLDLRRRPASLLALGSAYVVVFGALRWHFSGDLALWDLRWFADFLADVDERLKESGPIITQATLVFALWVRSQWRGSNEVELETMPRSVGIPFAIVTLVLIFGAASDRSGIIARAGGAYYVTAVAALALSQLAQSGATYGEVRAGGTAATLLGVTVAATAACALVFWVVFGLLAPIVGPPLGQVAEGIAYVVLYPPAWLLDKLFTLIFSGDPPFQQIRPPQFNDATVEPTDPQEPSDAGRAAGFAGRALILVVTFGVVGLVIAATAWLRSRSRPGQDDAAVGGSGGTLARDLRSMFRRKPVAAAAKGTGTLTPVRRLYIRALEAAAGEGRPRDPGDTPGEFEPTLATAEATLPAAELTQLYEAARYGGHEPDPAAVTEIERRWTRKG